MSNDPRADYFRAAQTCIEAADNAARDIPNGELTPMALREMNLQLAQVYATLAATPAEVLYVAGATEDAERRWKASQRERFEAAIAKRKANQ